MQVIQKNLSDTNIQLKLAADNTQLADVKQQVLLEFAKTAKVQGFRQGKAPLNLVEKNIDPELLQSEFLDRALSRVYVDAIEEHELRPVSQPKVKLTKFVPFTTLEFEAEVDIVGDIKLADYKKIKLAKKAGKVTDEEVEEVIENLRERESEKKDVDRAAKDSDQVWIDFEGTDAKDGKPIPNADGKNYPLTIGSNAFIPGFEPELVGLKANDEKSFTITFPKDYGVKALQNRKVTFKVFVNKVQEVTKPAVDDAFAAKAGPFKTVAELKADIKKQLQAEKDYQAERTYADELLTKITEASTVSIPESLVAEQIERLVLEQKQNVLYRGQTWQEFLDGQDMDDAKFEASLRPEAELRVKAGLVLAEIGEREKIKVTPDELDLRMQLLKGQYASDPKMQAELDKPETRRDIRARMASEKTIAKVSEYASATPKTE